MIFTFYKDHLEKPMATSPLLNSTLPMTKLSVKLGKPSTKQKQSHPTSLIKQAKDEILGNEIFSSLS